MARTPIIGPSKVTLAASVRLLAAEPLVIRLRWGIWNFQEVTVDLRAEPPAVQTAMTDFFATLADGRPADATFAHCSELSPLVRANLQLAVNELRQNGFLADDGAGADGTDLARALLGNLDLYNSADPANCSVAALSDSGTATEYLVGQATALGSKLDVLPSEFLSRLRALDLTSGLGGLAVDDALEDLGRSLAGYDSIVACLSHSSILTLRNLNRLTVRLGKPAVVGLVDGPFATLVGADSPRTGCLECFEQRSLARLEDHIGYHSFVGAGGPVGDGLGNRANGVESLLCAFLMNEAVLLRTLGTSRFLGRALSVYLPTYEMQAQDVLRIGTCPACGHTARDIAQEINFSSRVVIDQHVRAALGGTR